MSKFYVFYTPENDDIIDCFGTAEELVNAGRFPNAKAVFERAAKIKSGKILGGVAVVPMLDEHRCRYCGVTRTSGTLCSTCREKIGIIRRYKIWREVRV